MDRSLLGVVSVSHVAVKPRLTALGRRSTTHRFTILGRNLLDESNNPNTDSFSSALKSYVDCTVPRTPFAVGALAALTQALLSIHPCAASFLQPCSR
jgi:hypothetical protein